MAKLGDHPIIAERRLEALRHALGPTALAALIDPDVVEILANPDGQLIRDKIGGGRVARGETLTPEARDRVIRLIADYVSDPSFQKTRGCRACCLKRGSAFKVCCHLSAAHLLFRSANALRVFSRWRTIRNKEL